MPYFGMVAVVKGFLTQNQLTEALLIQKLEDLAGCPHRRVGDICIGLGYMSEHETEHVVQGQGAFTHWLRSRGLQSEEASESLCDPQVA